MPGRLLSDHAFIEVDVTEDLWQNPVETAKIFGGMNMAGQNMALSHF